MRTTGQLWDPVTEALLRCALIAIRLFPFESDVVLAACTCLDGLSRFTAVHRVSQLRHCAESLEESILGSLQRLSGPSLAQVSQKIVELSVAIHHHGIVHKVSCCRYYMMVDLFSHVFPGATCCFRRCGILP